jgi:hypothetical protein
MKTLLLIALLGLITACGKGGGGGATTATRTEPARFECSSPVKRDSLVDYAVSANKARTECNLSEEQAVQFVQITSM